MWTFATGLRESGVSAVSSPGRSTLRIVWSNMMTLEAPVTFLSSLVQESITTLRLSYEDSLDCLVVINAANDFVAVPIRFLHDCLADFIRDHLEAGDIRVCFVPAGAEERSQVVDWRRAIQSTDIGRWEG